MNALRVFASAAAAALFALHPLTAQTTPAERLPDPPSRPVSPVANSAAVVLARHARFTVLTPQLIRMEWAEDSRFEDHASLVFLSRNLPVPEFRKEQKGRTLTID